MERPNYVRNAVDIFQCLNLRTQVRNLDLEEFVIIARTIIYNERIGLCMHLILIFDITITLGKETIRVAGRRCCMIQLRRDLGRFPSPPSRHHGAGLWPAELGHPVEDVAPDHGLSRLRDVVPRLQATSKH